jgi:hypothetical protein
MGFVKPPKPLIAVFSRSNSPRCHQLGGRPVRKPPVSSLAIRRAYAGVIRARRLWACFLAASDSPARTGIASGKASANACFGNRAIGAGGRLSATATAARGTMVGRLVSNTVASGHLWAVCRRIIVLSTPAVAGASTSFGKYQSARNSNASNRLPTTQKYRATGIHHHYSLSVKPGIADPKRIADPTGKIGNCSLPFDLCWRISGKSGNRPVVGD